ncbi:helicase associated domain-containing protein [Microbacterium sp. Mcb102]|uniref:helicase associated domain-containing protein n=1 Tax=Microbacterium sp. Mcb102 TaxID=2926012 RepID=UPI0021C64412|nr:helicase associated domain-containing protein [Microbacterium sp. Mcb102]
MNTLAEYYALASDPDAHIPEDERAAVDYARADLALQRAVAEERPRPVGRAVTWCARAREVLLIARELRRCPRYGEVDFALYTWLAYQRRTADRHNGFQVAVLECIPEWSWACQDDAWDTRLDEVLAFVAAEGRPPRSRSEDSSERQLARWVERQRFLDAHGNLPYARAVAFRGLAQAA